MVTALTTHPWWSAILRWWLVLAASLVLVALVAPKRYTATSTLLIKKDRLPWAGFKTSKLPTWEAKAGSDDWNELAKELAGGEGASLSLWRETTFYFLLDQLAFDAYDFRPFLYSRSTQLEAVARASAAEALGVAAEPPDLLAAKVMEDLKVDVDEDSQLLTIAFTASDPQVAERMAMAYRDLLRESVDAMLDEKDMVTLGRLTSRVQDLEQELAQLDTRIAAYQAEESLIAPTKYLPAKYTELLGLRERQARQDALAQAADTYVALLVDRADAALETRRQLSLMDLGADPALDRPAASDFIYRDPTLSRLREDLAMLYMAQERDLLRYTETHPAVAGRSEEIRQVRQAIVDLLVQNNQVEAGKYLLESVAAHARSEVYAEAAAALEATLGNYPRWELDLLTLLRQRRINSALLGRMRDLEDMARSMVAKKEQSLIPFEDALASSKPTEPNLVVLGLALYVLGTLGAGGWLAFRDRLLAPDVTAGAIRRDYSAAQ